MNDIVKTLRESLRWSIGTNDLVLIIERRELSEARKANGHE